MHFKQNPNQMIRKSSFSLVRSVSSWVAIISTSLERTSVTRRTTTAFSDGVLKAAWTNRVWVSGSSRAAFSLHPHRQQQHLDPSLLHPPGWRTHGGRPTQHPAGRRHPLGPLLQQRRGAPRRDRRTGPGSDTGGLRPDRGSGRSCREPGAVSAGEVSEGGLHVLFT